MYIYIHAYILVKVLKTGEGVTLLVSDLPLAELCLSCGGPSLQPR